jgi:hypothetical protein
MITIPTIAVSIGTSHNLLNGFFSSVGSSMISSLGKVTTSATSSSVISS